eukprot:gene14821-20874_t
MLVQSMRSTRDSSDMSTISEGLDSLSPSEGALLAERRERESALEAFLNTVSPGSNEEVTDDHMHLFVKLLSTQPLFAASWSIEPKLKPKHDPAAPARKPWLPMSKLSSLSAFRVRGKQPVEESVIEEGEEEEEEDTTEMLSSRSSPVQRAEGLSAGDEDEDSLAALTSFRDLFPSRFPSNPESKEEWKRRVHAVIEGMEQEGEKFSPYIVYSPEELCRRGNAALIIQKYYRGMRCRRVATRLQSKKINADLESARKLRRGLIKQREYYKKQLVQQAGDVLLALQAQQQYNKIRERLMSDPRQAAASQGQPGAHVTPPPSLDHDMVAFITNKLGLNPIQILVESGMTLRQVDIVLHGSGLDVEELRMNADLGSKAFEKRLAKIGEKQMSMKKLQPSVGGCRDSIPAFDELAGLEEPLGSIGGASTSSKVTAEEVRRAIFGDSSDSSTPLQPTLSRNGSRQRAESSDGSAPSWAQPTASSSRRLRSFTSTADAPPSWGRSVPMLSQTAGPIFTSGASSSNGAGPSLGRSMSMLSPILGPMRRSAASSDGTGPPIGRSASLPVNTAFPLHQGSMRRLERGINNSQRHSSASSSHSQPMAAPMDRRASSSSSSGNPPPLPPLPLLSAPSLPREGSASGTGPRPTTSPRPMLASAGVGPNDQPPGVSLDGALVNAFSGASLSAELRGGAAAAPVLERLRPTSGRLDGESGLSPWGVSTPCSHAGEPDPNSSSTQAPPGDPLARGSLVGLASMDYLKSREGNVKKEDTSLLQQASTTSLATGPPKAGHRRPSRDGTTHPVGPRLHTQARNSCRARAQEQGEGRSDPHATNYYPYILDPDLYPNSKPTARAPTGNQLDGFNPPVADPPPGSGPSQGEAEVSVAAGTGTEIPVAVSDAVPASPVNAAPASADGGSPRVTSAAGLPPNPAALPPVLSKPPSAASEAPPAAPPRGRIWGSAGSISAKTDAPSSRPTTLSVAAAPPISASRRLSTSKSSTPDPVQLSPHANASHQQSGTTGLMNLLHTSSFKAPPELQIGVSSAGLPPAEVEAWVGISAQARSQAADPVASVEGGAGSSLAAAPGGERVDAVDGDQVLRASIIDDSEEEACARAEAGERDNGQGGAGGGGAEQSSSSGSFSERLDTLTPDSVVDVLSNDPSSSYMHGSGMGSTPQLGRGGSELGGGVSSQGDSALQQYASQRKAAEGAVQPSQQYKAAAQQYLQERHAEQAMEAYDEEEQMTAADVALMLFNADRLSSTRPQFPAPGRANSFMRAPGKLQAIVPPAYAHSHVLPALSSDGRTPSAGSMFPSMRVGAAHVALPQPPPKAAMLAIPLREGPAHPKPPLSERPVTRLSKEVTPWAAFSR